MDNYPEDIWDYLMYYAQPTEGGYVIDLAIVRDAIEHYFYN